MTAPQAEFAEQQRLAALHRLHALDQPRRADLDSLARLAAHVCGVPTASVNLIDLDRQWPAAAFGWEPDEVPRCDSMCAVSIQSRDVSVTRNAGLDPRWINNPFTTGELASVRFYASAPLITAGGEVVGSICAFSDEEADVDRVQVERLRDIAALTVQLLELHHEAHRLGVAALRDPLTGLPNRTLLVESAVQALARSKRGHAAPIVLFCDLDGFKAVNDTHGHAAGDALLCAVAERLAGSVRGSDVVARLGGDEFVILCESIDGHALEVDAVANRVREVFDEPVSLSVRGTSVQVRIGVSIGAVIADADETADDVLLRADAAMYREKQALRSARS